MQLRDRGLLSLDDPIIKYRQAYIVVYNTDAEETSQNTQSFDAQLRDYLIDHFFK